MSAYTSTLGVGRLFALAMSCLACTTGVLPAQADQVAAWGLNGYGQAWVPQNLSGVKAVASGQEFTLALLEDGTVRAWGGRMAWQTNLPPGLTNIAAIAACSTHCLALRSNGTVVGWGDGDSLNSFPGSSIASQITNPPVIGVKAISVGTYHSVLVQSNGSVWPYGVWSPFGSSVGSAPDPVVNNATAIATSDDFYLALKGDGTVAVRGVSGFVSVPSGLSDVKAIAASYGHCVALKSNGTVVAWGLNVYNNTNVPSGLSNVVAISTHEFHDFALKSDGTIVSWGSNKYGEAQTPTGLTNVTGIGAGPFLSFALVSNDSIVISKQPKGGTILLGRPFQLGCTATGRSPLVYQWQRNGGNVDGATNSTLLLTNVSESGVGDYRVFITNSFGSAISEVASITSGPIIMWGFNLGEQAQPPSGVTNPIDVVGPSSSSSYVAPWIAVNLNGSITAWGGDIGPAPQDLTNIIRAAAGDSCLLALRSNGTVEAWGTGNPTNVPGDLTNVTAITVGDNHCLALKEGGTIVAWGSSGGTNVPPDLSNISAIAARYSLSFVLKADGTVQGWGNPGGPPTSIPSGITNVAALALGNSFGLVLKSDGTVTKWGGPLTIQPPTGLSNVVAISAGATHAVALRSDGTLVSWGNALLGETNVPTGLSNVIHIASSGGVNAAIVGDGRPGFATTVSRRTVHAGSTLQLPAFAASSIPMSYQWFFNGALLEGQTNATLLVQNVPATVAGDYRVVVSNIVGVVTSAVITVTVTRDPLRFDTSTNGLNISNDTAHLRLTGLAGAGPSVLYVSTNLTDWEPISTNPPVVGLLNLTDVAVTNNPTRFYRAIEGP